MLWHDPLGVRPTKIGFGKRVLLAESSQKRPFVHNSVRNFRWVCSQFLAECSQFCLRSLQWKFKMKSITLLVGRGGGYGAQKLWTKLLWTNWRFLTFEKYRDTPPISIAILLHKYALLLAESSIYTTNLYHDMPPFVSRYVCRSIRVRGRLSAPKLRSDYVQIWIPCHSKNLHSLPGKDMLHCNC